MIQGHAIAGGCGLASICDFSIASQGAAFGYSEVKIGFIMPLLVFFFLEKLGKEKPKTSFQEKILMPKRRLKLV